VEIALQETPLLSITTTVIVNRRPMVIRSLLSWTAVLVFISPWLCVAPALGETPGDEFQLRYFELTQGRLAFTYTREKKSDVYVADFKELTIEPLVASPGNDEAPSWSPDGQRVAFHSDMSGEKEIYLIDADGKNQKQLTKKGGADENPCFSPDGKWIVYQAGRKDGGSEIAMIDTEGKTTQIVVANPEQRLTIKNVTPKFSPRGDEIYFATDAKWPGWDIAVHLISKKQNKRLSVGLGSYIRPTPKPDGSSLTFSYGADDQFDLWTVARGDNPPVQMFHRDGRELDPVWSEDGSLLFYVAEMTPGKGDFQIFVHNVSQNKSSPILIGKGEIRHLSWTPFPSIASLVRDLKRKQNRTSAQGDKPIQ
jgi:TolB protein